MRRAGPLETALFCEPSPTHSQRGLWGVQLSPQLLVQNAGVEEGSGGKKEAPELGEQAMAAAVCCGQDV